jgi:hypothetical protein
MEHRRTGPSARDILRLKKGDEALALGEPQTLEETRKQVETLRDGLTALQSVDDLGSNADNDRSSKNLMALQAKYDRLKASLAPHGVGLP